MDAQRYLRSLEQIGIKLGLEQIAALVRDLGRPDLAFPSIVIAGTNGKGSVTAMVERALRASGYRTGRYTSPHLVRLEERFAINGDPIGPEMLETMAARVQRAAGGLPAPPSFFEATTAVALEAFREAAVDVAVLEVGLGGRLDATNVVTSMAAAITAVDFDHEEYLGHTIEAIAREKSGVIKTGSVAVLGPNPPAVQDVVRERCHDVGAEFVNAKDGTDADAVAEQGRMRLDLRTPVREYHQVPLALRGRHQVDNAVTAVRLLETLDTRGAIRVPAEAVRTGLADATWPGRLELRRWHGHDVLIDGAHNPAGAAALAAYLGETYGRPLPLVFGAMRDKQVARMLGALLPAASCLICTAPRSPRAMAPMDLMRVAQSLAPALTVMIDDHPLSAVARALEFGSPVVVAGSLYLVGEIGGELS